MKVHEYQAKTCFAQSGISVPPGHAVFSPAEALQAAQKLGGDAWVVKAQIHAGGRGKGGGVKIARSLAEVESLASTILGMNLVTHQTGPAGQVVRRLLIEAAVPIARELYLSLLLDRGAGRILIMASTEGGMDIEEVAAHQPEKIVKVHVDPVWGLANFQVRTLAKALALSPTAAKDFSAMLHRLYTFFIANDCDLVEINPLVLTKDERIVALDAKVTFDGNALFRHPELAALRDLDEEHPAEIEASKWDLSYIALDGDIGCMVNGAGLAMATMDIIKQYGGEPANFLDVGGSATRERVAAAFKIISADPRVKGIFVNIFGGIVRCDMLAEGIIEAAKEVGLALPLVVRLEGTRAAEGRALLDHSGLKITSADTMADGACKIIAASRAAGE